MTTIDKQKIDVWTTTISQIQPGDLFIDNRDELRFCLWAHPYDFEENVSCFFVGFLCNDHINDFWQHETEVVMILNRRGKQLMLKDIKS